MFKIVRAEFIVPGIKRFVIQAPRMAPEQKPGQFVILRLSELGERIPRTIERSDSERGTINIVVQSAGKTTHLLNLLGSGGSILDVVGPLGKPSEIKNFGTVVVMGGGVGTVDEATRRSPERGFCCASCAASLLATLQNTKSRAWQEEEASLNADDADASALEEQRLATCGGRRWSPGRAALAALQKQNAILADSFFGTVIPSRRMSHYCGHPPLCACSNDGNLDRGFDLQVSGSSR